MSRVARRFLVPIVALQVSFAAVAGGGLAAAQTSERTEVAQAEFRRGVAALQARRFEEAAAALERSYRSYPSPVALYNLGLAHRELGHPLRAIDWFERYLSEGGDRVPADRVANVRGAIRELRDQLASVRVRVSVPVYTLMADGHEAAVVDGLLQLDPGDHVLAVTSPGYRPWRSELRLTPGERATHDVILVRDGADVAVTRPVPPRLRDDARRPRALATPHPQELQPNVESPSLVTRWWFWTGVGVVVAGGVVAGVLIANANASTEPPLIPSDTAFSVATLRSR